MIRRPITSIELKLDDLEEYDAMKRDIANATIGSNHDVNVSFTKPPTWNIGPKSTKEIQDRIGMTQQNKRNNPTGN